MYAVIKTGGKQYRVENGSRLRIDLLDAEKGSEIEIRDVLMVADSDRVEVGTPYVENAVVKAEVLDHTRDRKILVFRKLPRKGFKRLKGHRQNYTVVRIKEISFGG